MPLPTKEAAGTLLREHVRDEYQLLHALMVATAMEGYAQHQAADDPAAVNLAQSGGGER